MRGTGCPSPPESPEQSRAQQSSISAEELQPGLRGRAPAQRSPAEGPASPAPQFGMGNWGPGPARRRDAPPEQGHGSSRGAPADPAHGDPGKISCNGSCCPDQPRPPGRDKGSSDLRVFNANEMQPAGSQQIANALGMPLLFSFVATCAES